MPFAVVDAGNRYAGAWSRWNNPPRPLQPGESVVECDWDPENNRPVGLTMPPEPWRPKLASLRYDREVAGIIVDGVPISTERGDHRHTMVSLFLAGSANPTMVVPFKLDDGTFLNMTGAFAVAAFTSGQQYVAQCYAVEAAAITAIEAAETQQEIDTIFANLVWPSREFSTT